MASEAYTQKISAITANGTTAPRITVTPNKRILALTLCLAHAGGTNTLVAFTGVPGTAGVLTKIAVKVGTKAIWELTAWELRDYLLKHGTIYDMNGVPNTGDGVIITLPFAPEWLLDYVADSLALNPALLGGAITVELTSTIALTVVAHETICDDLTAPSMGFISLEVVKPVAGGTAFYVQDEIEPRGSLVALTIYPETGSTGYIEPTPVSLQLGSNGRYAHESVTSAQNDEMLERKGLTPTASGRTAKVYDMVFVKGDALQRAIDLEFWGRAKLKIEGATSMSGTSSILIERIERKIA